MNMMIYHILIIILFIIRPSTNNTIDKCVINTILQQQNSKRNQLLTISTIRNIPGIDVM